MIQSWQIQDAEHKFNEVIQAAQEVGPQAITQYGVVVAIVVSAAEYDKIIKPKNKLSEFFRSAFSEEVALDLDREKSSSRAALIL